MELENRSKRTAKKKEENKRIRMLVDNAYACDPRIKRFKEEAKREKWAFVCVGCSLLDYVQFRFDILSRLNVNGIH